MNILESLRVKVANKLYSTPPKRRENGRVITNVTFDYYTEDNILLINIERRCTLRFEGVTEQAHRHFIDFRSDKVNWTDPKQAAGLCLWFKTRGVEGLIKNFKGNWYENKISDRYVDKLMSAILEEGVYQEIA